ncbi:unnamed protein product [Alopecurus aequalis]
MSTQRRDRHGGRTAARWSDLPNDLLGTVRSRIVSPRDLARFAAVCRSWRAAASRQPAQAVTPLLLLSSYDGSKKHLCGPDDSWVLRGPSKAATRRPVGSQDGGWIALLDIERYTIAVMNLFSGAEVKLSPEQSNIKSICLSIRPYVLKIIFSGDPTSSNGCILAAIIEGCLRVTLCKVGCHDGRWTTCPDAQLIDIAFCNGELYGLTNPSWGGVLIKFEIGLQGDSMLVVTAFRRLVIQTPTWYNDTHSYISHIFELHGKPSMAVSTRWFANHDRFFKIFKLVDVDADEAYKHKWEEVTSLGDYALFICPTWSKAVHVPVSAEHRGRERNHIYYTTYTCSSIKKLPDDVVYSVTSDDGDEIKMYCKKDPMVVDGMERTGYCMRGCYYAMWLQPPDL